MRTSKKTREEGSKFIPLYNGIEDSYVIDSIGYYWVIGVPKGNTTVAGDTKFLSTTHVTLGIHAVLLKAIMGVGHVEEQFSLLYLSTERCLLFLTSCSKRLGGLL